MSEPITEAQLAEADRLVEETRERAAARVRSALGPSPAERERQLLEEATPETGRDPAM